MKHIRYVVIVLTMLSLFGCVSLSDSKTLKVKVDPKSQKAVAVTSSITVTCRDFILFFRCTLENSLVDTSLR